MAGILSRFGAGLVEQWVAGITVDQAVSESLKANEKGELAMVNYLGEDLINPKMVEDAVSSYHSLLDQMKRRKVKGCIAVKATQLGMCISNDRYQKNYDAVARHAARFGIFVWLDMEQSRYTTKIIDLYLGSLKKHKNIGICLQARLRRSYADAKRIVACKGKIRLVKGAYTESEKIMYIEREEVFDNYIQITKYLFEKSNDFIIATHDGRIIDTVMKIGKNYNKRFAFAMLKGIRGSLAQDIAKRGYRIFIYLPFGEEWLLYALRRFEEMSSFLLFFRSVFEQ